MKIIAIVLFLFSTLAYSATSEMPTAKNPFLLLGTKDHTSIYIGAFGDLLPHKLNGKDIILAGMTYQEDAIEGHQQGESVQFEVIASCDKPVAKVLPIWAKDSSYAKGIFRYDSKGKELALKIAEDFKKEPTIYVDPQSLLFELVESGCHYLGEEAKVKPNVRPIKPDTMI